MKFAQPLWLVLLILLPLLGAGSLMLGKFRSNRWAAFFAPRLRGALLRQGSPLPRMFALIFLLAACAAIIAALARPQGDDGIRTEKSLGRNLLIALDLSRSMRVRDVNPDRLSQAKIVIYELLDAMPNERVGLIGFAGDAYVYAPLTVDHGAIRETVEQIDETWVPLGGSNLAAAVELATETLKKTGQKNNALVILSDGEKHEGNLDAMIEEAARSGVYILAIGVGTEDGAHVPNPEFQNSPIEDRSGRPVISRLQSEVMRKLALETHGRYAVAGTGMDIPGMVKSAIKDLDAFEMEGRERGVFIEFYQWLVLPAILFLIGVILADTRWRGVKTAALVAGVFFIPSGARADLVAEAKQAMQQKCYSKARDAYHQLSRASIFPDRRARYQLGEASAAYQAKDYKDALAAFSRSLLSDDPKVRSSAHTGMGNTLFQFAWKILADGPYPDDPEWVPDLEKFDAVVKDRLTLLRDAEDAGDQAGSYSAMQSLITHWADAIRHYDSALVADPLNAAAHHNRQTTITYLKRLNELLDEDQQQSAQLMPQAQPGEGRPEKGDEDSKDAPQGDEGDDKVPKPPQTNGSGDEDSKAGRDGEKEPPDDKTGGEKNDKDEKNGGKEKADPKETPEDRARRILKENADLEKGPLTPGRRVIRPAEKDW
jgi:Ca-activated chloride channel family protein